VSSQCFVLFSKNLTFSAECNSDRERDQWLKSFKRMFTAGGKAVIDQKKRASQGTAASPTTAADTAPATAATEPSQGQL